LTAIDRAANETGAPPPSEGRVRIDKWLWAARFFKTRSLAAQAVEGGRVHVNDQRVKPAKDLKPGDALRISIGELEWIVIVRALSEKRGPAPQARTLYEETEAGRTRREAALQRRRDQAEPAFGMHGRPTKRDRRAIKRWTGE
jgi:ribosome-associated heat shock protein Hsp15